MDYLETNMEEVEAYTYMLSEARDAYRAIFRENFNLDTLANPVNSNVRKVTLDDEAKAAAVQRMERLMRKTA